jgi:hypothetical protein
LFTLGSVLKIREVAQSFGQLFFHGASYVLILTKNGWATIWATFSQTHLVTLPLNFRRENENGLTG